jgi:hypothetical protein
MPSIELNALESQVVALAAQKKNSAQATAQQLFDNANVQFTADVKLVTDAHPEIPKDAPVSFHVENGKGTVTWPDIAPKAEEPAA